MQHTWGIPGSTFLIWYLVTAVIVVIGLIAARRILFAGDRSTGPELDPQQTAYLAGGPRLAAYSSLAGLRGSGALGVGLNRTFAHTGPLPPGATALDQAVYGAATRQPAARIQRDPQVAGVLGQMRDGLRRSGLLTTTSARLLARLGSLILVALVALGILRIGAGFANGRPVFFLIPIVVVLAIITLVLATRTPARTRAGSAALTDLRRRNNYLSPSQRPAYETYGPLAAAMGVGLFGTAALYALDPTFASFTDAPNDSSLSGSGMGFGDSFSSSSSCSSGSSCSGGSSCGGGGCGGGGCGG